MLLRDLILISRVGQIYSSLVQFLPRHRPLLVEFLPAAVDFLLGGEKFLRGLRVQLGLLNFLRQVGDSGSFERGFGLAIRSLILLGRRRQVAILKHGQQLTFVHTIAALDVEHLDRRADFGRNRRLLQREQNRFRRDRMLNGLSFDRRHLHGNGNFLFARILGAARQQ